MLIVVPAGIVLTEHVCKVVAVMMVLGVPRVIISVAMLVQLYQEAVQKMGKRVRSMKPTNVILAASIIVVQMDQTRNVKSLVVLDI
ncbi:hypothetical protein A2867_00365 [Candidatus Daviesbacteria bacterium RIFCSPHIGHO2_01_FULL_40_11]|uniref:Uncharacterized protein n=1 Tax=Candidatus Daviesbacteria bacterium RIFCSPHIGHO2_01_FULL_40_11 TaxID=1797762 RepID=A0A1F5JME8_9BACT|nr:MAG: hypothetical protein A2867_00365 [Candidatus Daviesbacteria bacterium RIFCSPHIGHO2_01_FULL_40_11]